MVRLNPKMMSPPSRRSLLAGCIGLAACGAAGPSDPLARARIVQTVLGPLDASNLDFTLSHEHIAVGADVLSRWPSALGGPPELVAAADQNSSPQQWTNLDAYAPPVSARSSI